MEIPKSEEEPLALNPSNENEQQLEHEEDNQMVFAINLNEAGEAGQEDHMSFEFSNKAAQEQTKGYQLRKRESKPMPVSSIQTGFAKIMHANGDFIMKHPLLYIG